MMTAEATSVMGRSFSRSDVSTYDGGALRDKRTTNFNYSLSVVGAHSYFLLLRQ